ncbi:MAG: 23S rRNA (pseudouridine(1915)-N(3))-methyltransferase RlmH [Burkholderiaceae bacterium]|nr:23S rRNA (pseudouridine(1915)-N(3))-methyltransferase RlmH [Burkholderiaceae bacterium]MCD6675160.1 23S rRNA (pseudouridine(1915)-N(3))-methyltransferase RlmH [Burkholderiaceae bacterium]
MRVRIVAVGTKMPAWVDAAVGDYLRRLPPEWRVEWREVRAEARGASGDALTWMRREAVRIRAALPEDARLVALDERGADDDSIAFARRARDWQRDARPVAIVIGGPDGLDRSLLEEADEKLRLSSLTLPHALVRVVLAEQLFRAWSIGSGHPYHRGSAGSR